MTSKFIFPTAHRQIENNNSTNNPVSYTHLDVYKRQTVKCANCGEPNQLATRNILQLRNCKGSDNTIYKKMTIRSPSDPKADMQEEEVRSEQMFKTKLFTNR